MQVVKCIILFIIFILSNLIGKFIASKFRYRVEELHDMKTALSMFKTKIKFTYEPIPKVFEDISKVLNTKVSCIFKIAKCEMDKMNAGQAWQYAVDNTKNYLNDDDKRVAKIMSKMLGQSDVEGQISQIEVTEKFLDKQIKEAENEKNKNEKMFQKLGTVLGLALVIILI